MLVRRDNGHLTEEILQPLEAHGDNLHLASSAQHLLSQLHLLPPHHSSGLAGVMPH